jgi:DNA primase
LKADIATVLSDELTISIPGVTTWKTALPILEALQPETVLIAFDGDCETNPIVGRALNDIVEAIEYVGFNYEVETW